MYVVTQGDISLEIPLFLLSYLPRGMGRGGRCLAPPLVECPPGVPSSTPCVACSDMSSSLLSASSMTLPVSLPSVEVSVGAVVAVPVLVPLPSAVVLDVQDARIALVQSVSTRANVITAFFISAPMPPCAAFSFCGCENRLLRSAGLFFPEKVRLSRNF